MRDRVFRFLPTFDSPAEASHYVNVQARAWLDGESQPRATAPAATAE